MMMKMCRGTRKGKSPLDFRISDKIHRLRGGLEMEKKKKEKKIGGREMQKASHACPVIREGTCAKVFCLHAS